MVEAAADRRSARFAARRTLWSESSLSRVRHCGSSLCGRADGGKTGGRFVVVKLSNGKAGFGGLQTCASAWACPVCSQKIASTRSVEVQNTVDEWEKRGGRVVFLTLTMRHHKGQKLSDLWDALSHAWGKVTSGGAWVKNADDFGVRLPRVVRSGAKKGETVWSNRIPYIRAVEVTHGAKGWHVHIHSVLFVKEEITDKGVKMLGESIYGRWAKALVSKGLTSPTPLHGVDVKLVAVGDAEAVGKYVAKNDYTANEAPNKKLNGTGWEVVGGAGKTARGKNRTPFQILADVVSAGDADDLALWHVFEKASKGRRQLTWSVGLRELLGLNEEKTDEEIAEEELGGEVVMVITVEEWRVLRWRSCEVLSWAEAGADKKLMFKLMKLGFEPAPEEME